MSDCPNLTACPFLKKHCDTKDLACKGFISLYCKGPKQGECKRMEFKKKNGTPPPIDMMPNGGMIQGK